jgi:hypothetical protein
MLNLDEIIRQLAAQAEAIRGLVLAFTGEQAAWKPDPETWSMTEVMAHVYNEERLDFRRHLKDMLGDPPQPWTPAGSDEWLRVEDCRQALEGFLAERQASIAWLKALGAADWEVSTAVKWGTIRAGDVLVSWVEHDALHMRQMVELLHARNEYLAAPYSLQYAGGW